MDKAQEWTVKEIIEKLKEYPQDYPVIIGDYDTKYIRYEVYSSQGRVTLYGE